MRQPRRGLTMAVALVLLLLVATALLGMMRLVNTDARRTLDERRGAQLRALLLAGRDLTLAALSDGRDVPQGAVALPSILDGATLKVTTKADDEHCTLHVRATIDDASIDGRFELVRTERGWATNEATLGSDPTE